MTTPKLNVVKAFLNQNEWHAAICQAFCKMSVLPDVSVLSTPTPISTVECVQNRTEHSIYRSTWVYNGMLGEHFYIFRKVGDTVQAVDSFGVFSQLNTYAFNDELLENYEFTPAQNFSFVEVQEKTVGNAFQCGLSEFEFIGTGTTGKTYEFYTHYNFRIILEKHGNTWKSDKPLSQISQELVDMIAENIVINNW